MALTDKQAIFVEEYLTHFNATKAAIAAGYSRKTAYSIGHATLRKPEIAEMVQQRIKDAVMSADEALMILSEHANAAYADYLTARGTVDIKRMIDDGKARLIKGIRETEYGKVYEFHDVQAAVKLIGQHHKLFADRTELTGKDGGPIEHEHVTLTDAERAIRITAILDKARERRT